MSFNSSAVVELDGTGIEWMLWLGLVGIVIAVIVSRFLARSNQPVKNEPECWQRQVAMLGVIGLIAVPSLLRPEPTVAAWTDNEIAQGVLTADTLSISGVQCTTELGLLGTPIGARLEWSLDPSTMVASSYRVETVVDGDVKTVYEGANPQYTFADGLNLLGILETNKTIRVQIYATYITPNGTNWTTPEPGITSINYFRGLLLTYQYRCP